MSGMSADDEIFLNITTPEITCSRSSSDELLLGLMDNYLDKHSMVISQSRLGPLEKAALRSFSEKFNAQISPDVNENVTHVVVGMMEGSAFPETYKLFMGIAHHCWIVSPAWLMACIENNQLMDESPFEISHHSSRYIGVRRSRMWKEMQLFEGYLFILFTDVHTKYGFSDADVHALLNAFGGKLAKIDNQLTELVYVVGGRDLSSAAVNEYASKNSCLVISFEYLIACMLSYRILPLKPGQVIVCSVTKTNESVHFPYGQGEAVKEACRQVPPEGLPDCSKHPFEETPGNSNQVLSTPCNLQPENVVQVSSQILDEALAELLKQ